MYILHVSPESWALWDRVCSARFFLVAVSPKRFFSSSTNVSQVVSVFSWLSYHMRAVFVSENTTFDS